MQTLVHTFFSYSPSLSKNNSTSSSLSRFMMMGSTLWCMLSVDQYCSSKLWDCRTAPAHTSGVIQSLASSSLARRSARVKRCKDERTSSFHVSPHLFYCVELWMSWWQADDLMAPHTDGIVNYVLWLWSVLLAYEQKLRPCCMWWEGQPVLLQPFNKIPFLGGGGGAAALLHQLSVIWCIIQHQY